MSNPVGDAVLGDFQRQALMAGLHPTLAAAQAFATTDFRPDLASFKAPTLVIHGTADKTVPIDATGRVSAAKIPGAKLIEYDGSAHGLFATDKQRLIDDLASFLTANTGDGNRVGENSAIPLGASV